MWTKEPPTISEDLGTGRTTKRYYWVETSPEKVEPAFVYFLGGKIEVVYLFGMAGPCDKGTLLSWGPRITYTERPAQIKPEPSKEVAPMVQQTLPFEGRAAARSTDPGTSRRGAKAIQCKLGTVRFRVFEVFARAYPFGASNEDIYRQIPDKREDTTRPRVAELVEMGYIEEKGEVQGSRGVPIMTWALTQKGLAFADAQGLLRPREEKAHASL